MMNEGELEFCGKMEEQNVSVLFKEAPKPLTIFYRGEGQQAKKEAPRLPIPRLVVKVPALFRYASDKAVPWNYTSQALVQKPKAAVGQKAETSINDIASTRGMTRSGRCYAPINSKPREEESSTENGGIKIRAPKKKDKELMNELVTEAEANEFLKFTKHSEYSIVE